MKNSNVVITLETCIREALNTPEFIEQYNRLNGSRIGKPRAPIEQMIDKITGYEKDQMYKFFNFVRDYVWIPLLYQDLKNQAL